MIKIGINGFGRIGRTLFRLLLNHPDVSVAVVNDIADSKTLVHLLNYDSVHGPLTEKIEWSNEQIASKNGKTFFSQETEPQNIPWSNYEVDIVIECSGQFKSRKDLSVHIGGSVRKVILSVPPTDIDIPMIVLGVNDHILEEEDAIISNASCTTNSAAPMMKVVQGIAGIQKAYITTIHSYTSDQRLHDSPHNDLRRARSATQSIVPTTTGAAKAITRIFPELDGHIGGCGIRVPVPDGSLTDITFVLNRTITEQEVNAAFYQASQNELKGILGYTSDPIVSLDVLESPYSVLFDSELTSALGNMLKIVGWYDNEYGYSNRLIDLIYAIK